MFDSILFNLTWKCSKSQQEQNRSKKFRTLICTHSPSLDLTIEHTKIHAFGII